MFLSEKVGKSRNFCEEKILEKALLVNEDNIIGIAWAVKNALKVTFQQ